MKRLYLCFLLLFASVAHAQTPGDKLRVYLLTFGPGDAVWERFGHNAIMVQDEQLGYGIAYNWGMFSFDQPGFVPRLMKGRMLYWMAGYDANAFIDLYVKQNRDIWIQELNFTPRQREEMRDFLAWNAQEENKFYRYDYYRDNCSTRVRDAIDRITGGAVARALKPIPTASTYRSHTQTLTYTDPLTYEGLMLAMGPRIDQPLDAWQESFIPMELREWVRKVNVRSADGSEQPLVLSERTLFSAQDRVPLPEHAPGMVLPFTIAGFVIALLLLLLNAFSENRRSVVLALAVAVAVWSFLIGFFGTLIALLWAFTDHVVTYGNENVAQANTLSLILAVLAPAAILRKPWARRWAVWFALLIAGISSIGFLMQALPQLDQVNGEVIGLLLPVHGAIAWILWRNWRVDLTNVERAARQ